MKAFICNYYKRLTWKVNMKSLCLLLSLHHILGCSQPSSSHNHLTVIVSALQITGSTFLVYHQGLDLCINYSDVELTCDGNDCTNSKLVPHLNTEPNSPISRIHIILPRLKVLQDLIHSPKEANITFYRQVCVSFMTFLQAIFRDIQGQL